MMDLALWMHGSSPSWQAYVQNDWWWRQRDWEIARQIINIVNAKQGWGDFLKNVKNSFQEFFKYSCDMLMLLNVKVMHAILCLFEILLWLSIEVLIVCFNYQFNCDWFKAAHRWHSMKSELNSLILFTSVWYMYSIVCTCIN